MLISRTPFRISFFGGGSDFPEFYREHGGKILSTTINKYCHVICRKLPPFFPEKSRIVWSKIEKVNDHSQIEHASVKAALEYLELDYGVEIHHTGDLPARSGVGSSSAFTVGVLKALHCLQGNITNGDALARDAIIIERDILKENVGIQDQIACAIGGYNRTVILQDGRFKVETLPATDNFQKHFLLFFTGISRNSSEIAAHHIKEISNKTPELKEMSNMTDLAVNASYEDFGRLLHENWLIKRTLSHAVTLDVIDDIYKKGLQAGALGGKLLGAGGGGFMLFFAKPDRHDAIRAALSDLIHVPFEFEPEGARIIFNG